MVVNIVMYHYVRDNEEYDYDTFCRRKNEFESQIEFFEKTSSIVCCNDFDKIKYFLNTEEESCYLLTFDDGYKDHLFCANYLYSKKLSAFFFPPSSILNGNILDVNAIHMLIGKRGIQIKEILDLITELCLSFKYILSIKNKVVDIRTYLENFNDKSNYDDKNTLIIKRILQKDLIGDNNRKQMINMLLKKFICKNQSDLASELYLNKQELIEMKKKGMFFGSHGNTHKWLNNLNFIEQKKEIEHSLIFLKENNLISCQDPISLCFPFGGYDINTIKIMRELKIDLGFSVNFGPAKLENDKDFILKLPRWDTNHFWDNKWRRPCHPK